MDARPIVGIVTQSDIPDRDQPCDRAARAAACRLARANVRAILEAGGLPWLIPSVTDDPRALRAYFDRVDAVYLAGGHDLEPRHYREERLPVCQAHDPTRDRVEIALARWAHDAGKPVLGVCRGMQVINVALGGTLYQDLRAQYDDRLPHDRFPGPDNDFDRHSVVHAVAVRPRTRLASIFEAPAWGVNSMHHQGVRDLAPGLRPAALAEDGLVEALESPDHPFVVGVQWHPEDMLDTHPHAARLYAAFLDAARRAAAHDRPAPRSRLRSAAPARLRVRKSRLHLRPRLEREALKSPTRPTRPPASLSGINRSPKIAPPLSA